MLDVMSGGRLECAFPLGTGMEYWVNPINPSFSRKRFREGHGYTIGLFAGEPRRRRFRERDGLSALGAVDGKVPFCSAQPDLS
jgi:hypothetical protein